LTGLVKSLWASVQGDPVFMRRVNGWLTIFWIVMIPLSIATGWISSITYVAALSLWALVSGHWSAWQAARVEVKQAEEAARRDQEDLAKDTVTRIVAETDVERQVLVRRSTRSSRVSSTRPRRIEVSAGQRAGR
jgi:cobalamin biosynthesis protein CobD/CbiB